MQARSQKTNYKVLLFVVYVINIEKTLVVYWSMAQWDNTTLLLLEVLFETQSNIFSSHFSILLFYVCSERLGTD